MGRVINQCRANDHQERRRRLAFRLEDFELPAWLEWVLCWVVGWGHTPIWNSPMGPQCAWCDAEVPPDSVDTIPQDWWASHHA